ncbi:MAG: YceI family protein [Aquimonas sp.]|jgi:polyisoprenoid-binding protein YceI
MNRLFALLLLTAVALPTLASDWTVDPAASKLSFVAEYSEGPIDGRFNRFTPSIRFDAADLASARFDVEIDLASVSTGDEEWDGYLVGEDFFNVEGFPKARYRAERFEARDGGFVALGMLELRGVQQPVELVFSFEISGDSATLKGSAQLDRIAFGVGGGDWEDPDTIAHGVKVETELKLSR